MSAPTITPLRPILPGSGDTTTATNNGDCMDENGMVEAEPWYPAFHPAPGSRPRTTPLGGEPLPRPVPGENRMSYYEREQRTTFIMSALCLVAAFGILLCAAFAASGGSF